MSISFSERTPRNNAGTTLSQANPGMKMLLAEDPRFEWQPIRPHAGDASDMMLVLRGGKDATITVDEAHRIADAFNTLGFKCWMQRDYSLPQSYWMQANCTGEPRFGIRYPVDLERLPHDIAIHNFCIKVSAQNYRDSILPHRKSLGISE